MSDSYELARKRVEELKGFYIHLTIYVVVNLGLFLLDALQGGSWWFFWPALGWGIGVVAHAVALFYETDRRMSRWEERKVQEYVEKAESDERIGV